MNSGWIGSRLILRSHVSHIRTCRVTVILTESTLLLTFFAYVPHIRSLTKRSAVLILNLLRCLSWHVILMSCEPVTFPGYRRSVNVVCCHGRSLDQDSNTVGDEAVFDSKFLTCLSVAVRNVFQCICVMFRWPVADMTGHDSQLRCVYIVYSRTLYCIATNAKQAQKYGIELSIDNDTQPVFHSLTSILYSLISEFFNREW